MNTSKKVLASVVACFALVACSGPSKTPSAPVANKMPAAVDEVAQLDACKVLTKEIAESVIGTVTNEPTVSGSVGTSNCMYLADDFSAVTLLVTSGYSFEESFAASKGLSGVDPVKVEGLGEGAYWAGGTLNQLNVLKNGKWLIFMAPMNDKAQEVLTGVAQKALLNM